MGVIFIVLPLAMAVAGCAVAAFVLAVRHGQFDELETPPWRALFDDEVKPPRPSDNLRAAVETNDSIVSGSVDL